MARAKSKTDAPVTKTKTADTAPKKRRGRPPKATTAEAAKSVPTNGRKKRVGRPPKAQSQKAAAGNGRKRATVATTTKAKTSAKTKSKASAKTSAKANAATKKRVGRPPKAKAGSAKRPVGRPRKSAPSDTDGRRIPVSLVTTRAQAAAAKAIAVLHKERQALAQAIDASDSARTKARSSGERRDKTAAKRARQKVQRIAAKVAQHRSVAREVKAKVVELKAQDLLTARLKNIDVRLRRAEELASARIEAKVNRQTDKFRTATLNKLAKVEAKKAKMRSRKAETDRAALGKKFNATIQAAQDALAPKPRTKRRRRKANAG